MGFFFKLMTKQYGDIDMTRAGLTGTDSIKPPVELNINSTEKKKTIDPEVKEYIEAERQFKSFFFKLHEALAQAMLDKMDKEMTDWLEQHKIGEIGRKIPESEQITKLVDEIRDLNLTIDSYNHTNKTLRAKIAELEAQNKAMEAKVKQVHDDDLSTFKRFIDACNTINKLSCNNDILKSDIKDLTAERDKLVIKIQEWNVRIDDIMDKATEMKKDHNTKVMSLNNDIVLANRRLELCRIEIDMLQKYIARHCIDTDVDLDSGTSINPRPIGKIKPICQGG